MHSKYCWVFQLAAVATLGLCFRKGNLLSEVWSNPFDPFILGTFQSQAYGLLWRLVFKTSIGPIKCVAWFLILVLGVFRIAPVMFFLNPMAATLNPLALLFEDMGCLPESADVWRGSKTVEGQGGGSWQKLGEKNGEQGHQPGHSDTHLHVHIYNLIHSFYICYVYVYYITIYIYIYYMGISVSPL